MHHSLKVSQTKKFQKRERDDCEHLDAKGEKMSGNKHDNGVHEIGTDEMKKTTWKIK